MNFSLMLKFRLYIFAFHVEETVQRELQRRFCLNDVIHDLLNNFNVYLTNNNKKGVSSDTETDKKTTGKKLIIF